MQNETTGYAKCSPTLATNADAQTFPRNIMTFIQALKGLSTGYN